MALCDRRPSCAFPPCTSRPKVVFHGPDQACCAAAELGRKENENRDSSAYEGACRHRAARPPAPREILAVKLAILRVKLP